MRSNLMPQTQHPRRIRKVNRSGQNPLRKRGERTANSFNVNNSGKDTPPGRPVNRTFLENPKVLPVFDPAPYEILVRRLHRFH